MSEQPLSTIADINPPLPRNVNDSELVSFLGMTDVKESGGIASSRDVPFEAVKAGFTRFAEDDVLFAKITPCMENGKGALATGLTNGIGCGSTEFHVLRAKGENCSGFIYQVVQSAAFRQKAEMNMSGSAGQQRVPSNFFKEYPVHIPDPPQQRRIAEILSTLDETIEQTEALIAKMQQVKAGLMHDLFTRGVTPDGHLRPIREQAPELYKESSLGWIPKEWDVGELRNWLSYISYGFTNPMPEADEGPYMLTAADITDGRIQYETCRRTTVMAYDRLLTQKSRPKIGDVLLTKDGTLGRVAVVDRSDVCINQSVAVLRPIDARHSKFLVAMLSAPMWQQKMISDAGGSTIKHIYITVVDKMLIGWPRSPEELDKISDLIQNCVTVIDDEEDNLRKLRQQKFGLMHDLLTGRKQVN